MARCQVQDWWLSVISLARFKDMDVGVDIKTVAKVPADFLTNVQYAIEDYAFQLFNCQSFQPCFSVHR